MKYGRVTSEEFHVKSETGNDCIIYFLNNHAPEENSPNKPKLVWSPEMPGQTIRFPYHKNGYVVVEEKEYYVKVEEHFAFFTPGSSPSGAMGLKVISNGSGAGTTLTSYANRLGVVSLATGTTSTGRTCLHSQANTIQFKTSPMLVDIVCKLNDLPTTTDNFDLFLGFGDNNAAPPTDGAYFFCSAANPNWLLQTRIGNVLHSVDSGIAVDTDWHTLSVHIEQHPTRANFFIDDNYLGEQPESKTPQGSNQETAIQCYLQKTGTGVNNRTVHIDRIFYGAYY